MTKADAGPQQPLPSGAGAGAKMRKPATGVDVAARPSRTLRPADASASEVACGKAAPATAPRSGGRPSGPASRPRAPTEAPGTPANQPPRWTALHVSKTLLPRQPGTLRLLREHGDALVCVRYRHDTSGLYRYTTVELIVDHGLIGGSRFGHRLFEVGIGHGDREMRTMLMAEGSTWHPGRQTWCVSGTTVRRLKLWPHVVRPLSE